MITRPEINDFYRSKLTEHGASAPGVGWKDKESQEIRFQQLVKVIPPDSDFSINDLGCGTGNLITLLESGFKGRYTYTGYDALEEMINTAKQQFPEGPLIKFLKISDYCQMKVSDYSVASGIFNVRNNIKDSEWESYILATLSAMSQNSLKGFAFNALTKYSDPDRMRPDLFYSDPLLLFNFCKLNFSKNVALLHDYGIYDLTILVKKDR